MKKTKIAIGILLILLAILILAISYYLLEDTESKIPEEIKKVAEIQQEKFLKRNIFIIKPLNNQTTEKVILYFHGGSYMAEASQKHWKFLAQLANDSKATIIMPDYPLTPKHNYKEVIQMVEEFYKELTNRINVDNLILMGDSAGGGLALALEEKMGLEGIEMPNQTILISPWLDVSLDNPQIDQYEEKDKQLNRETLKLAGIIYASEDGVDNYLVSPINGDLSKLKNITILIGTNDILNPDVKLLKEKAEEKGMRRTN